MANRSGLFLAEAQVTAFTHELLLFPNEQAFTAAQAGEQVKFTPESLFASGLFSASEEAGGQTVSTIRAPTNSMLHRAHF
jgi:hypothetical protein